MRSPLTLFAWVSTLAFCLTVPALAQEPFKATFEVADGTISILAQNTIKAEKLEDGSIKLTYKIDGFIDPESYKDRRWLEYRKTLSSPKGVVTASLDMTPFDNNALVIVSNTEDQEASFTLEPGNTLIALSEMKFKGSEDLFSGDVKWVAVQTNLSLEPGEHTVLIKGLTLE